MVVREWFSDKERRVALSAIAGSVVAEECFSNKGRGQALSAVAGSVVAEVRFSNKGRTVLGEVKAQRFGSTRC